MTSGTMTVRYFLLGLLAQQPMTGYDIKNFLDQFNWLIGTPSYGSLYPALHMLLEEGLVSVDTVEPQDNRPARKVYSICDAGRQALRAWGELPPASGKALKAFVKRLIVADVLSDAGLISCLELRREQVAAHVGSLREMAARTEHDDGVDLPGQRLALGYGVAIASAELEWLDRTLERLT